MNYSATSDLLLDSVILVTGAGDGIGAAVAKSYAKHGATVVLLDKNIKAVEKTYDDIEANGGKTPAIYPLDLMGASVTDYETLASNIAENFGRLDGLVHCAASLGQIASFDNQNTAIWLETLHINLTAPYLLTRACVAMLRQQEHGAIIFTSDDYKDKAYWAGYGVAKAGIETLSKQLADEFESEGRLRVNCVIPGPVQTMLYARAFPGINPNSLPLPEDLVSTYLYLMGKDSLTKTGQCFSAQ
ncbi:MAG: SDR family NAD(P)-dependent oxidoreductase [Methylophaga sp.]|nr:SDR family NAD(P)-dependent oxidoreductase [Methylophaga sp.]